MKRVLDIIFNIALIVALMGFSGIISVWTASQYHTVLTQEMAFIISFLLFGVILPMTIGLLTVYQINKQHKEDLEFLKQMYNGKFNE